MATVGADNAAAVTADMPGAKRYQHLLSPGTIGGIEIANRIVQAPMGTGIIERGRVTRPRHRVPGRASKRRGGADHHRRRARASNLDDRRSDRDRGVG